jgi:hypothetical protein
MQAPLTRKKARGDRLRLTAPKPLLADLVARIRAAKPALLATLAEVPDWQTRHRAGDHRGLSARLRGSLLFGDGARRR